MNRKIYLFILLFLGIVSLSTLSLKDLNAGSGVNNTTITLPSNLRTKYFQKGVYPTSNYSSGDCTYINSSTATTNYGNDGDLYVGDYWNGDVYKGLFKYELKESDGVEEGLPDDALIYNATFWFKTQDNYEDYGTIAFVAVAVHRMWWDWTETEVTWNKRNASNNWIMPGIDDSLGYIIGVYGSGGSTGTRSKSPWAFINGEWAADLDSLAGLPMARGYPDVSVDAMDPSNLFDYVNAPDDISSLTPSPTSIGGVNIPFWSGIHIPNIVKGFVHYDWENKGFMMRTIYDNAGGGVFGFTATDENATATYRPFIEVIYTSVSEDLEDGIYYEEQGGPETIGSRFFGPH